MRRDRRDHRGRYPEHVNKPKPLWIALPWFFIAYGLDRLAGRRPFG